ncbi:VWA domain-containing protein [Oecophyllibacter saccharovorans]|uniref:VWA domain-containing protein n=1 Tax=Oecophyllibacter saccharovorans TaxID=2558360 RepID=UPI0011434B7D|nr:VWA domain-containing protein [Oecophyllibacter saccharovorans]QDH14776.1 VWA domain-containing protein [Oecophyllibacter saccharovorans]
MTQIGWAPLLPVWMLLVLGALGLLITLIGFFTHLRGTGLRLLALLVGLLWLADPQLRHPILQSRPQDVLLLVDRTPSMNIANRTALADQAVKSLQRQVGSLQGMSLHVVDVPGGHGQGTRLYEAMAREIPGLPDLAAVIMVTDGVDQFPLTHLPAALTNPPGGAPVPLHLLVTARGEETDRTLPLLSAPPYTLAGKDAHIRFQTEDIGAYEGAPVMVTTRQDSGAAQKLGEVRSGQPMDLTVHLTHPGQTLVELSASPLPGEASLLNNHTLVRLQGVRDRLRVLLISGVPNQSARVWRQLLKADPSVDLVHFTILRSPEMEDDTPLSDLALIPFPTHELFEQKIRSFDLIILDGFQNHNILPDSYLHNIAEFVRKGGGLLVVAGPEQTQPGALQDSPLDSVLPAHVTPDSVQTGIFHPRPSRLGQHHPVTLDLPPASSWGPWFRLLRPDRTHGETLLETDHGQPLLILDQVGRGRVAMMLSDQIWLWSRSTHNSGPQAELLRRLAHWLMKEPELEENRLKAHFKGSTLEVTRYSTTALPPSQAEITAPDGHTTSLSLTPVAGKEGILTGRIAVKDLMPDQIWTVRQGDLVTCTAANRENPIEDKDLQATATLIGPVSKSLGGATVWLGRNGPPVLRQVSGTGSLFGPGWIGVPRHQIAVAGATRSRPLFPGWLALPLLLMLWGLAWRREG